MLHGVLDLEGFVEVYKQWKMEVTFKIWNVISKCISKGKGMIVLTGFIWFRTGTSDRMFLNRQA
jgi:hypothetical protein